MDYQKNNWCWCLHRTVLKCLLLFVAPVLSQDFYVAGPRVSSDMDLLQAIDPPRGTPLGQITDITNGSVNDTVSYLKGLDGYPAFLLKRNANILKSAAAHIKSIPEDFALLVTLIPSDEEGGFLFAVVDPLDTVIQLGLSVAPDERSDAPGMTEITLYYTDYKTDKSSQVLAEFTVPSFVHQWTSIALKVEDNLVTLYMDCMEYSTQETPGRTKGINIESGSSLFIGKGGDAIGKPFAGGIQQLTLTEDIDKAESQCDDLDPNYQEFSGSEETGIPGGFQVIKGEKGERGERGFQGEPGPPGIPPPPLTPPPPNYPGYKGDQGERGLPGIPGLHGRNGQDSKITGPPGLPGPPSQPGLPGQKGEQGATGALGDRGLPGTDGRPGLPGVPGSGGFDNEDGNILIPGPPGPAGPPGNSGFPGLPGQKGEAGNSGIDGLPGLPGPPGPGYGTHGGEYISGSGDGEEILPLPGLGGPGVPGPRGPPGTSGRNGIDGLPGVDGRKGESGPRGQKGDMGSPGIGTPGLPGSPGLVGPPGAPGRTTTSEGGDIIGPPGHNGNKGEKGDAGSGSCDLGCEGVKGDIGPRGKPGTVGSRGSPGIMGEIGLPGFSGRPGGRGLPGISVKGQKGESGSTGHGGDGHGIIGPPGPPGHPGTPGAPGRGVPGAAGPQGPPGTGSGGGTYGPGPPGPPGPPGESGTGDGSYNGGGEFTPSAGAVTFRNLEDLYSVSLHIPFGTITFVLDRELLLLRVQDGFKEIPTTVLFSPDLPASDEVPTTEGPEIIAPPEDTSEIDGPGLHLIAANSPVTGQIGGISGADFRCYREARAAGLKGTYRAFLSSRVQDLTSIVHRKLDRTLPVLNRKNQVLFNSWNDMFNGAGGYYNEQVPILSFDKSDVMYDPRWPQKIIWHGATTKGRRNEDSYCDAWSSESHFENGVGSSLIKNMILDDKEFTCNNRFILLCMENSNGFYRK